MRNNYGWNNIWAEFMTVNLTSFCTNQCQWCTRIHKCMLENGSYSVFENGTKRLHDIRWATYGANVNNRFSITYNNHKNVLVSLSWWLLLLLGVQVDLINLLDLKMLQGNDKDDDGLELAAVAADDDVRPEVVGQEADKCDSKLLIMFTIWTCTVCLTSVMTSLSLRIVAVVTS